MKNKRDKCCPTCGAILPLDDLDSLHLTPQQRCIVDIVTQAGVRGVPTNRVADLLYEHDASGGPDNAQLVVHVQVCKLNKVLAKRGKVIRAPRGGNRYGFTNYTLRNI